MFNVLWIGHLLVTDERTFSHLSSYIIIQGLVRNYDIINLRIFYYRMSPHNVSKPLRYILNIIFVCYLYFNRVSSANVRRSSQPSHNQRPRYVKNLLFYILHFCIESPQLMLGRDLSRHCLIQGICENI